MYEIATNPSHTQDVGSNPQITRLELPKCSKVYQSVPKCSKVY